MQGNGLTIGGRGSNFFFINWQLAGQNVGGNYSTINWQAYFHFNGADAQLDNGQADLSGLRWNNGGRVYNYAGNFSTRDLFLASGSFNIGHNGDGTQGIGVSGGVNVYQTGRSSGGASWSLPTIPRHSVMTGANDFSDEQNPYFTWSNPANTYVDFYMETPYNGGGGFAARGIGTGGGGGYSIELTTTERNIIRSRMPNSNTMTVRYVIHDTLGGDSWSFLDRTVYIVNGNPVFTDSQLTYEDTNPASIAVTGDDQKIVQNQSTLQLAYTAAAAQKYATIASYNITVNGVTTTRTAADTIDYAAMDIGTDLTATVEAVDSRGNKTTASKVVSVLAWLLPRAVLTIARVNNYEDDTEVKADVTIDSVNGGNAIEDLVVRYKKVSDVSYAETDLTNSTIETLDLDKVYEWNIQIVITDKFGTTTYNAFVPKGLPIMFIDSDKLSIGIGMFPTGNETLEIADEYLQPLMAKNMPIGFYYMSTVNTNPGTLTQFGGTTWTARGSATVGGRTVYYFERTA